MRDAPVCGSLQYLAPRVHKFLCTLACTDNTKSQEDIFENSDLSVEQFSVWVKHYYAVSSFSFGSYSAHFLDFKLDSAQTES